MADYVEAFRRKLMLACLMAQPGPVLMCQDEASGTALSMSQKHHHFMPAISCGGTDSPVHKS